MTPNNYPFDWQEFHRWKKELTPERDDTANMSLHEYRQLVNRRYNRTLTEEVARILNGEKK